MQRCARKFIQKGRSFVQYKDTRFEISLVRMMNTFSYAANCT